MLALPTQEEMPKNGIQNCAKRNKMPNTRSGEEREPEPRFTYSVLCGHIERQLPLALEDAKLINRIVGKADSVAPDLGSAHAYADGSQSEKDGAFFAQWVEAFFLICYPGAQALANALRLT
jgi:hypothetical protein